MENYEPKLFCPDCSASVFNMKELLQHKKVCPDRICVICMDKHASTILEPCLHNKCCAECMYKILQTSNKCPLCRTVVLHVHGEINYDTKDILEEAARLSIVNFNVLCKAQALAVVNWQQFIAFSINDHLNAQFLEKVALTIAFAWPQVYERAMQIVHQHNLDLMQMSNELSQSN